MKLKAPKMNVSIMSLKIVLICIFLFALLDMFAKFKIFNISYIVSPIFVPLAGSLFILSELGLGRILKGKKKLDSVQAMGFVIAILGLISIILFVLGLNNATILAFQGIVDIALLIFFGIEIFKKNN